MTKVIRQQGEATARLRKVLKELQNLELKVGWFSSAAYENGIKVAYIASIQEYGYSPKHIPPRMGLRGLMQTEQGIWASFAERGARMALQGTVDAFGMMTLVGGKVEGDIRRQITRVHDPILADVTLMHRAYALGLDFKYGETGATAIDYLTATAKKPLVEPARPKGGSGGLMLATVSHLVYSNGNLVAGKENTK